MKGNCVAMKSAVKPIRPKTLKFTQKSVLCVRQTISLRAAEARKKPIKRSVKVRHALSGIAIDPPKRGFSQIRFNIRPILRIRAKAN